jgi:hypothetical protein
MPVIENAAPLTVAEFTVSVAVPGFEIVSVRVADVPTVMLPKLTAAGETAICATTSVVAVPLSETTVGVFTALLINDTEPLMGPANEGVTVIDTLVLPPGEMVAGSAKPEKPKLASLVLTAVMIALLSPELVNATVRDAVLPTSTAPKSAELGVAVTLGGALLDAGEDEEPVLAQPARTAIENATTVLAMH